MSVLRAVEWQFWIDVGGTFTDCIARQPDGTLATYKLLSTGVIKGLIGPGSTPEKIRDPGQVNAPPRFFDGYICTILNRAANSNARDSVIVDSGLRVTHFDAAARTMELDRAIASNLAPGMMYELRSGEEAPITGIR